MSLTLAPNHPSSSPNFHSSDSPPTGPRVQWRFPHPQDGTVVHVLMCVLHQMKMTLSQAVAGQSLLKRSSCESCMEAFMVRHPTMSIRSILWQFRLTHRSIPIPPSSEPLLSVSNLPFRQTIQRLIHQQTINLTLLAKIHFSSGLPHATFDTLA